MSEKIEIKELNSFSDFIRIHNMYRELSSKTKYFFTYPVFSWSPMSMNPILWILGNIALILSLSPLKKIVWLLFPKAHYLLVGAFYSNKLVGVTFLFKFDRSNRQVIARNFGIVVRDEYQGKGVGSKLIQKLFSIAKEKYHINEIYLEVLTDNKVAIKFYKKYGFQIIGTIERSNQKYFKMKKVLKGVQK